MPSDSAYLEKVPMPDESDSLIAALSKARIPSGNHAFISDLTSAIGTVEYRAVENVEPYVIAKRRDDGPDLRIYYGYTTGFASEEEIIRTVGTGFGRAPSSRKGTWYVEHPINNVRPSGARSKDVRREAGFCGCGMQLSLSGVCASCD